MATIEQIKKRDGRVVEFDRGRIERAIMKACAATGVAVGIERIGLITDDVIAALVETFPAMIPGVEDIQDVVERKLAEHGLFEVAKAYIIYRKEHEEAREEQRRILLEKLAHHQIKVRKRSGRLEDFDVKEIVYLVHKVCGGESTKFDLGGVVEDAKANMYDGIPTSEINRAVVMALSARIERDPVYSRLAARFLFNDLYRDVLGVYEFHENFPKMYRSALRRQIEYGVGEGRLDKEMLAFDFDRLSKVIVPERDALFHYLGAETLHGRYFLKNNNQKVFELPQHFWMRVGMALALREEDRTGRAIEFYEAMSELYYIPSSPTLFHAGTARPQMSSCYLTTVEDDLGHIFKCIGDNAQLSKWAGGVANDWTNIRATGAWIKSTNFGSQGVVPFLKVVDATTAAINRSGRRRGATCVYLEIWHADIEAFLELRKNTGDERRRTHDTNTANWVPDLFMKRLLEDGWWTLFSPDETPDLHHIYGRKFEARYKEYEALADQGKMKIWKRTRARELWRKMITMLYETGHPWLTFKDPCNIRSPQDHVGVVHSSNLCTEITLNTSKEETAVCNLGSLNLARFVENKELNRVGLAKTVRIAMRMLDNVIDLNYYPTPEAEMANLRHRPVGLGIMGLQDAFYKAGLNFESEEAVDFSDQVMEFISYHAILASSELAKERGTYSSYQGSKWDRGIFPIDTIALLEEERGMSTGIDLVSRMDWSTVRTHVREHGMRNSNCMGLAPTASIGNIAGAFPTSEPIYKNVYTKSNISGEFTVVNEYLVEDLKRLGLWNDGLLERLKYYDGSVQRMPEIPVEIREKYKEAFELDSNWIVRHAAYRGKWIDQSQSVNIFTASKSGKQIADVYISAWKMGLKTTYYLRTLGASGIEKATIDINKKYEAEPRVEAVPAPAPAAEAVKTGETCDGCQ